MTALLFALVYLLTGTAFVGWMISWLGAPYPNVRETVIWTVLWPVSVFALVGAWLLARRDDRRAARKGAR